MKAFLKKHTMLTRLIVLGLCSIYFFSYSYATIIGIQSVYNAIAVMGVVIVTGYTNQMHLGQFAFVGIGAYTSAVMMTKLGMNFWLTIPCAMILAALFGLLLGIPALKLRGGPYLALVTQIFGEIVYTLLLNLENITGGSLGLSKYEMGSIFGMSLKTKRVLLAVMLVFLVAVFALLYNLLKSKFGRFFLSIKESEAAAQSCGVNTTKYKLIAFTLSSAVAGLAGVFYAQYIGYLSPDQFRWNISLTIISMAIIGGVASLDGAIIGAFLLTAIPELLRLANAQTRMIIYGTLLMLVLVFLPNGLVSLIGKSRQEIKKMFHDQLQMIKKDEATAKRHIKLKIR